MTQPVTEQELAAKSTGRRVTLAALEANIASEHYFTAQDGLAGSRDGEHRPDDPSPLALLTFCVLVLKNGYTVTGQSACADPANYNASIGVRLAREDAVRQVWPLMGYALKEELAWEAALLDSRAFDTPLENTYIGTKMVRAIPMNRLAYNILRGWQLPAGENGDDAGYLVEYTDRIEEPAHVTSFHGYVSWSPKEVFERAYRRVGQAAAQPAAPGPEAAGASGEPAFITRLRQELEEVSERYEKLKAFLPSEKAAALSRIDRSDLIEQLDIMKRYVDILTLRLRRLTWNERTNPNPA